MNKLTSALAGIGRRFINPYGSRLARRVERAKAGYGYRPHQNEREISRRLRQECRKLMKAQIVYDSVSDWRGQFSYTKWDELRSDPEAFLKFQKSPPARLIEIRNYLRTEI